MIHVSKLLRGGSYPGDAIRFAKSGAPRPPVVVWHMTDKCNLSCRHCYAAGASAPAMPPDEAREFLRALAALNPPALLLSGGEPLSSPHFFDFLDMSLELGLRPSISTNGTLIDERVASRLASRRIGYVGVSLDGPRIVHDAFRGRDGAFADATKGIENLKNAGCRVGLRFTMARPLLPTLPDIMRICEDLSVDRVCFYHFIPTGGGRGEMDMLPSRDETRHALFDIFDWTDSGLAPGEVLTVGNSADGVLLYLRLKEAGDDRAEGVLSMLRRNPRSGAPAGIISVRWDGTVFADQFSWDEPLGNWRGINDIVARRAPIEPGGRCAPCSWKKICGGNMRARARALTGDPAGEDPGCALTDEETRFEVV